MRMTTTITHVSSTCVCVCVCVGEKEGKTNHEFEPPSPPIILDSAIPSGTTLNGKTRCHIQKSGKESSAEEKMTGCEWGKDGGREGIREGKLEMK